MYSIGLCNHKDVVYTAETVGERAFEVMTWWKIHENPGFSSLLLQAIPFLVVGLAL